MTLKSSLSRNVSKIQPKNNLFKITILIKIQRFYFKKYDLFIYYVKVTFKDTFQKLIFATFFNLLNLVT